MASAAQRMYYAMLGGASALLPSGECLPYTMPVPTAVDINLNTAIVLLSPTSVDVNLCEELV